MRIQEDKTYKKKVTQFYGCSYWRAESFSCILEDLHEGLYNILQFDLKIWYFFQLNFSNFGYQKSGSTDFRSAEK